MSYTAINLSLLAPPNVVEALSFETIFAAKIQKLQELDPTFTALLESDPAYKILEACAYDEMMLRQRINDAARAVMLAYSTGADLDHQGALLGTQRLEISPANPGATPPVEAVMESDDDFRRRIQLSLEGFSVAGPEGAYIYHGLSADPAVLDISAVSPDPGEVLITVLSRTADGAAGPALISAVAAAVSADDVRPLTDEVTVVSAEIVDFQVEAVLHMYNGPDPQVVLEQAGAALDAYLSSVRKIGYDITVSGLYAALHQPGVQHVELISPSATVTIGIHQAGYCTGKNLSIGANDE